MINPLQITWRNLEPSPTVEEAIREHAKKLDRYFDPIQSCRVLVEIPHLRHRHGRHYHVRIALTVPGRELIARRDPAEHAGNEDIYVALREAFDDARRQLQDAARARRGDQKRHEEPARGVISSLWPEQGYGFIQTPEGRELYFHRNALSNGSFDDVTLGAPVEFVEDPSPGPHASFVRIHHPSAL